jgi:hypothetical protein
MLMDSPEDRRWERGKRVAGAFDAAGGALDEYVKRGDRTTEFRQRVRTLAESQWGEPVNLLYLKDFSPAFDVPGRREDGTRKGTRLVRRFLWNILRGIVNGVANVFLFFAAGGGGNVFARLGQVTGPADAQALGLVDAAKSAKGLWLVYSAGPAGAYSPKHAAVIDSHHQNPYSDPADIPPPTFLWQAAEPYTPRISPRRHRLTWQDGSTLQY